MSNFASGLLFGFCLAMACMAMSADGISYYYDGGSDWDKWLSSVNTLEQLRMMGRYAFVACVSVAFGILFFVIGK